MSALRARCSSSTSPPASNGLMLSFFLLSLTASLCMDISAHSRHSIHSWCCHMLLRERMNRKVAGGHGGLGKAHGSELVDVCQHVFGDLTGAGSVQEESCLYVLHLQQHRGRQLNNILSRDNAG